MALIKSVRGFTPEIGKNCFLADNATLIGDVKLGDDCSVWFNTVLRGDVNSIRIGNGVNIQDGSVLHTLYEKSTIEICTGPPSATMPSSAWAPPSSTMPWWAKAPSWRQEPWY